MTARVAGRGPPAQPLADAWGADVLTPGEALRKIGWQQRPQPLAEPGAVMDQATAGRPALVARPWRGLRWSPGLEPVLLRAEPREESVGLPRLRHARLGATASRDWARVAGGLGERTNPASFKSAEMSGPRAGSRQPARGWPAPRVRDAVAQASSASGVCGRRQASFLPVAPSTRQRAGWASAPSLASKAAHGAIDRPPAWEPTPRRLGDQARGSAAKA
jgi:hypothetical protein